MDHVLNVFMKIILTKILKKKQTKRKPKLKKRKENINNYIY
jgi:hypothetical protein